MLTYVRPGMRRLFLLLWSYARLFVFQITRKKTVEEVVIHGEELDPSLKTSEAGGAHVVSLNAPDAASFFRDSPYAWGDKKGCSKTTILVSGRWRSYDVNTRACVPPMVFSRMPADVANKSHLEVDFESPSWLSAMKLCEEDETPARQVERTTLVSLESFRVLVGKRGLHSPPCRRPPHPTSAPPLPSPRPPVLPRPPPPPAGGRIVQQVCSVCLWASHS